MKIRCKCGTSVMKSHGDVVKLRSRIVILEKGKTLAKCMNCGCELEVPVTMSKANILPESSDLKHYVTK